MATISSVEDMSHENDTNNTESDHRQGKDSQGPVKKSC